MPKPKRPYNYEDRFIHPDIHVEIHRRVMKEMKIAGITTITGIGEVMGWSDNLYRNIQSGRNQFSLGRLYAIAGFLGISIHKLLPK